MGETFTVGDKSRPEAENNPYYSQPKDVRQRRYGTTTPDFKAPPARIYGVDVDRSQYGYTGQSQNTWNREAQWAQNRGAFQGDWRQAQQMRAQQQAQLGQMGQTRQMYLDAAMGNAPSLAQAQLQQGVDRGIAGQMALANSAHGSAAQRAGMMRGAQLQGQDMMAGLGAQSAAVRAQETAAARQGLLGTDAATAQAMAGMRGQDQSQSGMQLQAQIQNRAQNDAMMQAMYGYGMHAADMQTAGRAAGETAQNTFDFNTQTGNANLEAGYSAADKQMMGQMVSGGAGAAAGLMGLLAFSDKRAKTKIEVGDKDVDSFLKTLKPYSYEYKDKAHGVGKKTSVMAQDLEKTSLGETLVSRHKSGLRQVDYAKALPVMLASMGRLADRLEKAEARK